MLEDRDSEVLKMPEGLLHKPTTILDHGIYTLLECICREESTSIKHFNIEELTHVPSCLYYIHS